MSSLIPNGEIQGSQLEVIEEILYTSDLGPTTVTRLLDSVEAQLTRKEKRSLEALKERVKAEGVAAVLRNDADNDFHLQIARGCRNRFLADMICRDLYPLLRVFRYRTTSTRAGQLAAAGREHAAIVRAIERREPDKAERLMRSHIAGARDSLIRHLRERGVGV